MIKFDNNGFIEWQKTYSSLDISNYSIDWAGEDIDLTDDGGAIIAIDSGQFGFLKLSNVTNILIGDLNSDNQVDVLDIVLVVNLILLNEYLNLGDLNDDSQIDVLDIVLLVNLILN